MKIYEIEKVDINGKVTKYGHYSEDDVKLIVKGYKWNGLFYERKNSKSIYMVTEVK